ncbi:hypothetical protein M441DRAFT_73282 [Trichoderma asperellum CBS 433.97]|uniref:Uncharacterized protein n=1 Tax=Trichoderma asperellum (strain ATCC 204424 / CBS 433.97 / NBRC 101777) TaxID=1042311 RepID=A0A2T3YVA0_TRIA4|nr:hypothetical protein M441DRAFT_73282 [Trichoderma asperellum CBS 433.97]PTB36479.1 hypothetical protein M441DRAFT_73282 [Trichoderma asperellum CBS 433.97]
MGTLVVVYATQVLLVMSNRAFGDMGIRLNLLSLDITHFSLRNIKTPSPLTTDSATTEAHPADKLCMDLTGLWQV